MSLQCPYCKDYYYINLDRKEINDLIFSNIDHNYSLLGLKKQMENIINDITNIENKKTYLNEQFKNIIITINNIINEINKNINTLKNFNNKLNGKKEYGNSKDNIKKYNIKSQKGWESFLSNKLFSNLDKSGNRYHDILTKAAIVGVNGTFWAYSSNFHLSPFQFEKIKQIFEKDADINKTVLLEEREYKIINSKKNFSIDLEDGDVGATIAKTKMGFVFGFFNTKINYTINGKEEKQNSQLCNKVVEELALELIKLNY